jgi:hypothetical protein
MRTKKHNNGNVYLLTSHGIWVRDFTREITPIDINKVTEKRDYGIIVENEIKNNTLDISEIDTEKIKHTSAVIVSDGFDFDRKHHLLAELPPEVLVIVTNRALVKWKVNRKIDYLVVNNPYSECLLQIPKHRYFPSCVASTRTNYEFMKEYDRRGGTLYRYDSVREEGFSPAISKSICCLDDYRNPVCASIVLAYKFGVKRLMLFCCDGAFAEERPGAEKLPNGKWIYPQQRMGHSVVDGTLHWYAQQKVKLRDHSSGPEYNDTHYISEDEVVGFFN